jgi:hypothetical protein
MKKKRPRDVNLNAGISPVANENAQYYMLTSPFINTFSKEEAEQATRNKELRTPQKIERILTVPLLTINSVLDKYLPEGVDIISMDSEGYDLEILQTLDFAKYHPQNNLCRNTSVRGRRSASKTHGDRRVS